MTEANVCLRERLSSHSKLTPEDEKTISDLQFEIQVLERGTGINDCSLMLGGVAGMYDASSGAYTSFHYAGDWLQLGTGIIGLCDEKIRCLGRVRIAKLPVLQLRALVNSSSTMRTAFWRELFFYAAVTRAWLCNVVTPDSQRKMAWFFCDFYIRTGLARRGFVNSCEMKLSQSDVARTLGMATVTCARTLQKLRRRRLLEFRRERLTIKDVPALASYAGWTSEHLAPLDQARVIEGLLRSTEGSVREAMEVEPSGHRHPVVKFGSPRVLESARRQWREIR